MSAAATRRPPASRGRPPAPASIAFRWTFRAARGEPDRTLEIAVRLRDAAASLRAALRDDDRATPVELIGASVARVTTDAGLLHIDAGPALRATVALDGPRALYARTNLFESLGIAGGRYELTGVRTMASSAAPPAPRPRPPAPRASGSRSRTSARP